MSKETEFLPKGYIRYTDVIYEWPKNLYPEQYDAIKTCFLHDAITNPLCPLNVDGKGTSFYVGKMENNGGLKLLLHTDQLEYMIYYIHTVQVAGCKRPIPMPSSESIIKPKDCLNISVIQYENAKALKAGQKKIDKHNKASKGKRILDPIELKTRYTTVQEVHITRKGNFLAIDFETCDVDHNIVLEIGYSGVRWVRNGNGEVNEVRENGHWCPKENVSLKNKFGLNHRYDYLHGTSDMSKSLPELVQLLHRLIKDWDTCDENPLFLIFHAREADLQTLNDQFKFPVAEWNDSTFEAGPYIPTTKGNIYILDTQDMYGALAQTPKNKPVGLSDMLSTLGVPFTRGKMHNAGNDAYATLDAFVKMATSPPIEKYRAQLWPEGLSTQLFISHDPPPDPAGDFGIGENIPGVHDYAT